MTSTFEHQDLYYYSTRVALDQEVRFLSYNIYSYVDTPILPRLADPQKLVKPRQEASIVFGILCIVLGLVFVWLALLVTQYSDELRKEYQAENRKEFGLSDDKSGYAYDYEDSGDE